MEQLVEGMLSPLPPSLISVGEREAWVNLWAFPYSDFTVQFIAFVHST